MNFRLLALEEAVAVEEALIATPRSRWPTEHYPDGDDLKSLRARSGT